VIHHRDPHGDVLAIPHCRERFGSKPRLAVSVVLLTLLLKIGRSN
jgi:hypothetical protein